MTFPPEQIFVDNRPTDRDNAAVSTPMDRRRHTMKNQHWNQILGRAVAACLLLLVPVSAANWLSPRAVASMSTDHGLSFVSLRSAFDGPSDAKLSVVASDQ